MLLVKWHFLCVSEPQPPKRRQFGTSMGRESLLAESIRHLLPTSFWRPSCINSRTYALAENRLSDASGEHRRADLSFVASLGLGDDIGAGYRIGA